MSDPIIFFEITDRCNHACWYCCKDFRGHPGLTMRRDALDRVLALPKSGLVVSGGEPSLARREVAYILSRASVPVSVNTNLTGWTPRDLRELSFRARLNIAVPSMFEEEYAAITGSSSFLKMLGNLEHADRESMIAVAVHGQNRERLGLSVSRLAARGFRRFMLQPVYGTAARKDDFAASVRAVQDVRRRNAHLDIRFMSPCAPGLPATHACDAGRGRLVILSNGDFVPCACRKMAVLGNLFAPDFDFGAVREAGAAFYQSFPPAQRPLCKGYL